jgi:hypothetical protein
LIPLPPDEKVPLWVQERESKRCSTVLAEYVQHLYAVVHRAYPLAIIDPMAPEDEEQYPDEYDGYEDHLLV